MLSVCLFCVCSESCGMFLCVCQVYSCCNAVLFMFVSNDWNPLAHKYTNIGWQIFRSSVRHQAWAQSTTPHTPYFNYMVLLKPPSSPPPPIYLQPPISNTG